MPTLDAPWLHQAATQRPATGEAAAESRIAELHGAETAALLAGGAAAATQTVCALTNPGGHVIASAGISGPVREFLEDSFRRLGRTVSYTDCADVDAVAGAVRPETQLIVTESLSDPAMRLIPVNELAELAHSTDLQLVVDNTGLSPALLRPLDLGATVVVETVDPYLDDHAALDASVVCGPRRLVERVTAQAAHAGGRPDGWTDRLLAQALRTLDLRMAAHTANADQVAAFLRGHPAVTVVHRPSFDDSPWAIETHGGFGGLLSFESRTPLAVPDQPGPVSIPVLRSHAGVSARRREQAGVTPTLVRVAAGIDSPKPLIALLQGLLAEKGAA
ncbi:cystathionine beta-lyase [Actinoplanes ianthinogenes]|uniref:Cystathionine beta-lyase n=1 Tax=Actinoplanes ianthinogenes TaxID=122358 RepID=A0ABM7LXQ6_9ACTN|nr:PLP-dependent transferase [Actinoplanes ianthinogenes]BCJ44129.1 cystathionine beta-lyase [Actinoplanes ianthinogenes]GGQ95971.1 cystathionine beta-lyase [Actinoplanes ianthinogenes]